MELYHHKEIPKRVIKLIDETDKSYGLSRDDPHYYQKRRMMFLYKNIQPINGYNWWYDQKKCFLDIDRGRNKKTICDLCNKEMRSDKLKKHKESCKKRILPLKKKQEDRLRMDCEYCKKHYERHYIKKHMEICKKKRNYKPPKKTADIKDYFKNKKNKNYFVVTEAEEDGVVEISDSEIEEENEDDRNFIDDSEVTEDADLHRQKDNDEVRERLRDLGMEITNETAEKCKWCEEEFYNLEEHEKKCDKKTFNCYNCGEKFPANVIKTHYRLCKKLVSLNFVFSVALW